MRTALLAALVVLCGCNQLFVEAHVSALCQHLPAQSFTVPTQLLNLPTATFLKSASMEKSFAFDISLEVPEVLSGAQLAVALSNVTLNATRGDFGFIEHANITLQSPAGSSLPSHTVVEFRKDSAASAPTSLDFRGDGFDLAPYLQAGVMTYVVALEGTAPMADFTADVDACAEVSLHYNYAQ